MMDPSPRVFLLLLSLLITAWSLLPLQLAQSDSIYEQLRANGLPIGLLPKGISDFWMDATTGLFRINLTQPCNANAQLENPLHYDFNVSGRISFGRIGQLSGVKQQDLFLWFPVKGIRVDVPNSGLIHFDVGVVVKQFSLSLFENPLECSAVVLHPRGSENESGELAVGTGKAHLLRAAS